MPSLLSPVNTATTISAGLYNSIQSNINYVLEDLYGGSTLSFPVTNTTVIKPDYWTNLMYDANRCLVHQTGLEQGLYAPSVVPATDNKIYASYVNAIITATNYIYNHTSTHAVNQIGFATEGAGAAVSSRTGTWGSTVTHHVSYTWANAVEAQNFFNLGGFLFSQQGCVPASASPGTTDTQWVSMVQWVNAEAAKLVNQFTATNYYNGTPISITTSATAFDTLELDFNKVSSTVVTMDAKYMHLGYLADLDITSTATYAYSMGTTNPVGVASPRPQVQSTSFLGDAGAYVPYPTKVLTVGAVSSFNLYRNKPSPSQTIVLGNEGSVPLTITGINYTSNGGVTAHPSGITFPITLAAGSSTNLILYYTATVEGTFANSFTVTGNNDRGDVTVKTSQVVIPPLYEISVSPTSWTTSTSSAIVIGNFFSVTPDGWATDHLVGTITGNSAFRFSDESRTKTTSEAGLDVYFFPSGLSTGTYTATITVVGTSVNSLTSSTVATMSIDYTRPPNQNLGSWISPAAEYDAIVGMSYDTVDGVNYLTIGLGGGADRAPAINAGGLDYLKIENLGFEADTKPNEGSILYRGSYLAEYCEFLRAYGVWIDDDSSGNGYPFNYHVKRSYIVELPADGTYTLTFAADSYATFTIDGTVVGDLTSDPNPYQVEHTESRTLTAGTHTLGFDVVNRDGPGRVAMRLVQSNTGRNVWSTILPVRAPNPFLYWSEVYRIPLTNGAFEYVSITPYLIKNRQTAEGNAYGVYFGAVGSLLVVKDDGLGNLDISFNPKGLRSSVVETNVTLSNIPYLPYYYSPFGNRYRQLDNAPIGAAGKETRFFLGFDRFGKVRTSVVPVPIAAPDYSIYVPSGGGGGGGQTYFEGVVERGIASVVQGQAYTIAAEAYNAYLISIGAETGFIATGIAEAVGVALFELGIVAELGTAIAVAEGVGILAVVAAVVCFRDGTLIAMADGTYKNIKDIKAGDKVFNHNKTSINTVTFLEYDRVNGRVYSPTDNLAPFATLAHPLVIDSKLYAPEPDTTYINYPWLGKSELLTGCSFSDIDNEMVYNLWVDGDNTYMVNGYGTHSILGDGSGLADVYRDGFVNEEETMEIFRKCTKNGVDVLFGSYLFNFFLRKINSKSFRKLMANILKDDKHPILTKLTLSAFKVTGKIVLALVKIKRNKK